MRAQARVVVPQARSLAMLRPVVWQLPPQDAVLTVVGISDSASVYHRPRVWLAWRSPGGPTLYFVVDIDLVYEVQTPTAAPTNDT